MSTVTDIIKDGVDRIMMAMAEGVFSKKDLEMVKKVFEESIVITDKCLARGPNVTPK